MLSLPYSRVSQIYINAAKIFHTYIYVSQVGLITVTKNKFRVCSLSNWGGSWNVELLKSTKMVLLKKNLNLENLSG